MVSNVFLFEPEKNWVEYMITFDHVSWNQLQITKYQVIQFMTQLEPLSLEGHVFTHHPQKGQSCHG